MNLTSLKTLAAQIRDEADDPAEVTKACNQALIDFPNDADVTAFVEHVKAAKDAVGVRAACDAVKNRTK